MGSPRTAHHEAVLEALQSIFNGPNADIRKLRAVRNAIVEKQDQANIKSIIGKYSLEKVCILAHRLLQDGRFEPKPAKMSVPEPETPPAASADTKNETVQDKTPTVDIPSALPSECRTISMRANPTNSDALQSLPPVQLPFPAQHQILSQIQSILELACFRYAQRRLPQILEQKKWSCPESVELNQWAGEFQKTSRRIPIKGIPEIPPALLKSMATIRHTAVHRERCDVATVARFINDAEAIAGLLEESASEAQLRRIRQEIKTIMEELQQKKKASAEKFKAAFVSMAVQRAQLERLRDEAIATLWREDRENLEAVSERFMNRFLFKGDGIPAKAEGEQDKAMKPIEHRPEGPKTTSMEPEVASDAAEHDSPQLDGDGAIFVLEQPLEDLAPFELQPVTLIIFGTVSILICCFCIYCGLRLCRSLVWMIKCAAQQSYNSFYAVPQSLGRAVTKAAHHPGGRLPLGFAWVVFNLLRHIFDSLAHLIMWSYLLVTLIDWSYPPELWNLGYVC